MSKTYTVTFPDIGEGVVEGEIIEWRKNVGDSLKQDEAVVVVMTDKATVELPSPYPGILSKQYYQSGEKAIKDRPLYEITLSEEVLPAESLQRKPFPSVPPIIQEKAPQKQFHEETRSKKLAAPKVRHFAKQLGIDLENIEGSLPGGRIQLKDLQPIEEKPLPLALWNLPNDTESPLKGIQGLMAKKMAQSKARIPHFSYFEQVDATRLIQLRQNVKAQAEHEKLSLTYMPFIIRALSLCLQKHPILNSSLDVKRQQIIFHQQQNIGIAVASPLGLIVPVLKSVEKLSFESLLRQYQALIEKAQTGKLQPEDMKEGTITISNFGANTGHYHGLWATPIINYPEVAILAIGRIHSQPVIKNGAVAIRDMLNLSWSFDHRLIDGHTAAQISNDLCGLIDNPASLL